MLRKILLISASGALLATTVALVMPGSPTNAQATTIDVGTNYFCAPSFQGSVCDTTVTPGSTVTWQVSSGFHTVTECDATFTTCPPLGGFDSGALSSKGGTFQHTFNTPGTFPYHCSFHPDQMRGRILVQAQATATPAPTAAPGSATPVPTAAPSGAAAATLTPAAVPASGGGPGGGSDFPFVAGLISLTIVSVAAAGAGVTMASRRAA